MISPNPFAERPAGSVAGKQKNQCPPDMPRGDTEEDKAARQRYWLERGNAHLAATGKGHLHWCAKGGAYWIDEKAETSRRIEFERKLALLGEDQ